MASGPEHYREAEDLLNQPWQDETHATLFIAQAQVHATLALAAATVFDGSLDSTSDDWCAVTGTVRRELPEVWS
jgi:hypothetical protein